MDPKGRSGRDPEPQKVYPEPRKVYPESQKVYPKPQKVYPEPRKVCCCCCCCIASVGSDSVRPHRRQPTRLPVPGILQARTLEWVAIFFFNACEILVKVKSLSRVRL